MIERKFVAQKIKEFQIQEYVAQSLTNVGHSHTKMVKTPLGEKIVVYAARPGLVVGKKGQNIKLLTKSLKKKFRLENPQIEIAEVERPNLDANIVAEKIVDALEHFGSQKFKAICHKAMTDVMNAGGLGIEINISGKVPSDRAKSWRFYSGYLKKCGDIAIVGVRKAHLQAHLKTGVIGVKVTIMPPDTKLPDDINIKPAQESKPSEPASQEPAVPVAAQTETTEAAVSTSPPEGEISKDTSQQPQQKKRRKAKEKVIHENQGTSDTE